MIDAEDEGELNDAAAYLSDLEPHERTEEQSDSGLRVCERYDGPFDNGAPATIRGARRVYLYTNYQQEGDEIESQELDIDDAAESD